MKALLALVALSSSAAVHAPTPEHSADTANEAAVYALSMAYAQFPHYYEYGGVIVKMPSGKFNASKPTTDGHADNVEIDEDPDSYESEYPIVADYHTHPCLDGYVPGSFSPSDLHSMRSSNRPGYMLDECTGDIHYWAPGDGYDKPDDKASPLMKFFGPQLSRGKIVGHIPVDGKAIAL